MFPPLDHPMSDVFEIPYLSLKYFEGLNIKVMLFRKVEINRFHRISDYFYTPIINGIPTCTIFNVFYNNKVYILPVSNV